MPGRVLREADPQCPGLAACHTPGPRGRLIHLLKKSSRVFQERLSSRTDFHSAWKAVKQLEAQFIFQTLNLSGECGLCHAQPLCGAPVMLFLSNRHEVS